MRKIQCVEALYAAWDRMKLILFTPFNFVKWLTLGFATWLAYLGQDWGGGNMNFNTPDFGGSPGYRPPPPPPDDGSTANFLINTLTNANEGGSDSAMGWIMGLGAVFVVIIVVVIIIALILGFVLLWVKSRAEFILVDDLVHNRAEIVAPWKKFRE